MITHIQCLKAKLVSAIAVLAFVVNPAFSSTPLHWERIHVYHALPSQVFQKLGLTHNTRYGHNLGSKRQESDPSFPVGLTDVVPYDIEDVLIVRGTLTGLRQFRRTVASADVPLKVYSLTSQLIEEDTDGSTKTIATNENPLVVAGHEVTVTLGSEQSHTFLVKLDPASGDGTLVTEQAAIPIISSPHAATYLPPLAWTRPIVKTMSATEPANFTSVPILSGEHLPPDAVLVLRLHADAAGAAGAAVTQEEVKPQAHQSPEMKAQPLEPRETDPQTQSYVPTDAEGN